MLNSHKKYCHICLVIPDHIYSCFECNQNVCYQHSRLTSTATGNLEHCEKCWEKKIKNQDNYNRDRKSKEVRGKKAVG